MDVGHLCKRPAATCEQSASLEEAGRLMRDGNVGCLIVTDQGQITGIVTDRDILTRGTAAGAGPSSPIGAVMSEDVACAYEADDVIEAATLMATRGCRRLPVLDLHGSVIGVVALDDLMSVFADQIQRLAYAVRSEIRHGSADTQPQASHAVTGEPR